METNRCDLSECETSCEHRTEDRSGGGEGGSLLAGGAEGLLSGDTKLLSESQDELGHLGTVTVLSGF